MIFLRAVEGGISLAVHAQPKASRTAVVGVHADALKIAVQAPPVEGAANEALVEFLAKTFAVAKRAVSLKTGDTGRKKVFLIAGVSEAAARARLEEILP